MRYTWVESDVLKCSLSITTQKSWQNAVSVWNGLYSEVFLIHEMKHPVSDYLVVIGSIVAIRRAVFRR